MHKYSGQSQRQWHTLACLTNASNGKQPKSVSFPNTTDKLCFYITKLPACTTFFVYRELGSKSFSNTRRFCRPVSFSLSSASVRVISRWTTACFIACRIFFALSSEYSYHQHDTRLHNSVIASGQSNLTIRPHRHHTWTVFPVFYNGPPSPPSKLPLSMAGSGPIYRKNLNIIHTIFTTNRDLVAGVRIIHVN